MISEKKPIQTETLKNSYFVTKKDQFDTPVKTPFSPLIAPSLKAENLQEITPQIRKHKASFKIPQSSNPMIQQSNKTSSNINYVGFHVVEPTL